MKLQLAMKSSGRHPLVGTVHADELYIGGESEGLPHQGHRFGISCRGSSGDL